MSAATPRGPHGGGTDLVVASLESWDRVWRRNQHLVSGLLATRAVARVLFVEPAADPLDAARRGASPRPGVGLVRAGAADGVPAGRLWRYQPTKWLPRRLDAGVDERLARATVRAAGRLGLRRPLLWVNDPGAATLLRQTGWPALYDITDDWLAADRAAAAHARLVADEEYLLANVSEVVVCSPTLERTKEPLTSARVTLVPNAVDVAAYRLSHPRPADLPAGPVAGYVGTVHRDRMDLELCAATARALAGRATLVLVGPAPLTAADRALLEAAGVVLLGARDADAVPAYLQHADVLLVPHVVDPFTDSLDPIKLYEYRAAGRPVVATPVAGFRESGDPRVVVAPPEEFPAAVVRALDAGTPAAPALDVPSWSDRVSAMREVLARLPSATRRPAVTR